MTDELIFERPDPYRYNVSVHKANAIWELHPNADDKARYVWNPPIAGHIETAAGKDVAINGYLVDWWEKVDQHVNKSTSGVRSWVTTKKYQLPAGMTSETGRWGSSSGESSAKLYRQKKWDRSTNVQFACEHGAEWDGGVTTAAKACQIIKSYGKGGFGTGDYGWFNWSAYPWDKDSSGRHKWQQYNNTTRTRTKDGIMMTMPILSDMFERNKNSLTSPIAAINPNDPRGVKLKTKETIGKILDDFYKVGCANAPNNTYCNLYCNHTNSGWCNERFASYCKNNVDLSLVGNNVIDSKCVDLLNTESYGHTHRYAHCADPANTDSPGCVGWLKDNPSSAESILATYCPDNSKYADGTTKPMCGCYMRQSHYDEFYNKMKIQMGEAAFNASGAGKYRCTHPDCINNLAWTNGSGECPDQIICTNNLTLTGGDMTDVKQLNNCYSEDPTVVEEEEETPVVEEEKEEEKEEEEKEEEEEGWLNIGIIIAVVVVVLLLLIVLLLL